MIDRPRRSGGNALDRRRGERRDYRMYGEDRRDNSRQRGGMAEVRARLVRRARRGAAVVVMALTGVRRVLFRRWS